MNMSGSQGSSPADSAAPSALPWYGSALILLVLAQGLANSGREKLLPPFEAPPVEEHAVADVSAALAGARRFGADLAFIQFLHYIAQPLEDIEFEQSGGRGMDGHGHDHFHAHGAGEKPMDEAGVARIVDYSLRSVNLDPYFHYSYLFSSGFLAFYLNRFEDALRIIQLGVERDPTYWRFRLYAGAIGYKSRNQTDQVIPLLEEAVQHPDCPTMIMNILGNLYESTGAYGKAAGVYRHILTTANDEYDLQKARRKLQLLQEKRGV